MNMLELFNIGHFVLIGGTVIILGGITIAIAATPLRKNKKHTKILISVMLWFGFVIHFTRLPFPPHGDSWPSSIQYITPISISAFCAIVFPFIFHWGNRTWRDFMFYFGILGGIIALVMPIAALDRPWYQFDAIRFFIQHGINGFAPLLMVICGHHRINWRWAWVSFFVLLFVLGIILVNEILLTAMGVVEQDMQQLLSAERRNGAMIMGPEPRGGLGSDLFNFFCPPWFQTALFDIPGAGVYRGDQFYWPIIWVVVPGIALIVPICIMMGIMADHKRFGRDIKYVFRRRSRKLCRIKH